MTTEEKLKLIKEIHDKIAKIDSQLDQASKYSNSLFSKVSFHYEVEFSTGPVFELDEDVLKEILGHVEVRLKARRLKLIETATDLIK
ncbi:MAG: hypothetical protein HOP30_11160 [Cyclobacteriaceae bacterium]|nr:hypothetical protein [Cyclobacteriaceae bacterium]